MSRRPTVLPLVTARCYAERGIAMASCLSVRLSPRLRYRGHIGWNFWKIISRLISLFFPLSADLNITDINISVTVGWLGSLVHCV